jgi:hypothetical protein
VICHHGHSCSGRFRNTIDAWRKRVIEHQTNTDLPLVEEKRSRGIRPVVVALLAGALLSGVVGAAAYYYGYENRSLVRPLR